MQILKKLTGFCLSFLVIYICLYVGRYIASLLPFIFPGSIIGLLLLFLLLEFKIMRLEWIMPAGNLLMKHMAFLFIPSAVGMVAFLNEVYNSALIIIVNVLAGIVFIILVVGRLFQHYTETPSERAHRKEMYHRAKKFHKIKKVNKIKKRRKLTKE